MEEKHGGLWVCVPHLPVGSTPEDTLAMVRKILDAFFEQRDCSNFIFWYYTPMALQFSEPFTPAMIVYDCMDELSAFNFAPPRIRQYEQRLLEMADIVFTGGASLCEAKKARHHNIHPFPSSIDKAHFLAARKLLTEPQDQASIAGIKLGFYGVIDERFDQELRGTRRPSRKGAAHSVGDGPTSCTGAGRPAFKKYS
ncbi:hypothetical protein GCM10007423_10970 [Dyadobacter endophyticus]|uniref:Uncharacterized protein n=1 Tax=Dyadobacter endophyticus TaxID=1749036 RepID=A0ABQ1YHY9_9BACT|nr:hypothetical protein [Dyadobacter endophyticus]GGH26179.1 hypothetical protein GCM10007423_10970 [Dyadobacter endophyticus]